VASALGLLRALPALLWQASGSDLGGLLADLDALAAVAGGTRVAVAAEAMERGEIAASQSANTRAWVATHAPSLGLGSGAGQVANLVEQTHRKPALAPVREAVISGRLPVPVAQVVLAEFDTLRRQTIPEAHHLVLDGLIRIGYEDGAREVRRLRPALLARYGAPDELDREQDRAARLVALSRPVCTDDGVWQYGFTADAEAKAILEASIGVLSAPWHPDGTPDPRTTAQRRGQALVEVCRRVTAAARAAGVFGGYPSTDAAAAAGDPHQTTGHGSADPSSREGSSAQTEPPPGTHPGSTRAPTRASDRVASNEGLRGEVLQPPSGPASDCATRGVASAGDPRRTGSPRRGSLGSHPSGSHPPGRVPPGSDPPGRNDADGFDPAALQAALAGMGAGGAKATLMLTMPLRELTERIGAAAVLGTTEGDTLLAPETARRIACDAAIIPVVLGSHSEVLDLGRTERLFSPAQARAVLLRDRHCTFPGCDIPAFWTQLHHVTHWADGGATDTRNAALLCTRHHTIVHRDRLTATITPTTVTWDTVPRSYDRFLQTRQTPAA